LANSLARVILAERISKSGTSKPRPVARQVLLVVQISKSGTSKPGPMVGGVLLARQA